MDYERLIIPLLDLLDVGKTVEVDYTGKFDSGKAGMKLGNDGYTLQYVDGFAISERRLDGNALLEKLKKLVTVEALSAAIEAAQQPSPNP